MHHVGDHVHTINNTDKDKDGANKSMMMTKLEINPDDFKVISTSPSQKIDETEEPMINTDSEDNNHKNITALYPSKISNDTQSP